MTGETGTIEGNSQATKKAQIEGYDNTEVMDTLLEYYGGVFREVKFYEGHDTNVSEEESGKMPEEDTAGVLEEKRAVVFDGVWSDSSFTYLKNLTNEQSENLEKLRMMGRLVITEDYVFFIGEEEFLVRTENIDFPLELDSNLLSEILKAIDKSWKYSKKDIQGRVAVKKTGDTKLVFPFFRMVDFFQTPSNFSELFDIILRNFQQ